MIGPKEATMKNTPDGYEILKKYTVTDGAENDIIFTLERHHKYRHRIAVRCYINDHMVNVSSLGKLRDAETFFNMMLKGACDE